MTEEQTFTVARVASLFDRSGAWLRKIERETFDYGGQIDIGRDENGYRFYTKDNIGQVARYLYHDGRISPQMLQIAINRINEKEA